MTARALMPDTLRLFALFGIVVVNVQFIAFPATGSFTAPPQLSGIDAAVHWLVNGLALLKTYGLFCFMFGVGLGFLMRAAARRGAGFGRIYRNRMLGLAGLGLLHGCLFFPGDILLIYAVTGSILYAWRDWPAARLVRLGAVLLAVQILVAAPLLLALPAQPDDVAALEREFLTNGSFVQAVLFRTVGFAVTFPLFLLVQGISALGWFCLGLAAVKSGIIDEADHPLWQRARRFCLLPGVGASLGAAALIEWGDAGLGYGLLLLAAPIATLGYLGGIAALARPPGPVMAPLLAAGGSSLSIYLGQSILLTTLFSGYGLGLWDAVSRGTAVALALGVTVALMGALLIWRRFAALGPFEWVLRRITYAGTRA